MASHDCAARVYGISVWTVGTESHSSTVHVDDMWPHAVPMKGALLSQHSYCKDILILKDHSAKVHLPNTPKKRKMSSRHQGILPSFHGPWSHVPWSSGWGCGWGWLFWRGWECRIKRACTFWQYWLFYVLFWNHVRTIYFRAHECVAWYIYTEQKSELLDCYKWSIPLPPLWCMCRYLLWPNLPSLLP